MAERTLLESGNRTRIVLVREGETQWIEKSLLAFANVQPERVALAREAALSRLARSPFVAAALDPVGEGELHSFRRTYIDGRTLAELRASRATPTEPEILRVTRDLLGILSSLHELENGDALVHGDVTPKNVYLTKEGVVMLTDFGLARLASDPPLSPDAPVGTTSFLPPEVGAGETPTPRADVHQCALLAEYLFRTRLEDVSTLDRKSREALVAARSSEPRERPTSRELASVLEART